MNLQLVDEVMRLCKKKKCKAIVQREDRIFFCQVFFLRCICSIKSLLLTLLATLLPTTH